MKTMTWLAALTGALLLVACGDSATTSSAPGALTVKVLSNRADLISGGDALVEVVMAEGAKASDIRMTLDGADVTSQFALRGNGRYLGLVTGMADSKRHQLKAQLPSGIGSTIDIVNHPNGGPIFTGPQPQPWTCQPTAVDEKCNQPAEYSFLYRSTDPTQYELLPYDPANPPSDVATTTTDEGVTMPFIVRLERGYQARDEYKIMTLFDPAKPWDTFAPQAQWNHKLLIPGGADCRANYAVGGAPLNDIVPANPVIQQTYVLALSRGFAVLSTALANLGHNCNVALQAESLMMGKERLIEQYGEVRYTIGTGCSGGSIVQNWVSNSYPGIYDGLLTQCTYPDVWSPLVQFGDFYILRQYFDDPSKWAPGVVWTPQHMADVEGHVAIVNSLGADEVFSFVPGIPDPESDCNGIAAEQRYNAATNPGGKRCSLMDYNINLMGTRPPEVWSANEQLLGKGFAGGFMDNVGIQFGLQALRDARITPAQFVDLNAKLGGVDIDWKPIPQRVVADTPALANSYRSGAINDTRQLDRVAIINSTGPDPGAAHDSVHTWWVRWRLDREHGTHNNQVIWGGPVAIFGDPYYPTQSFLAMDRWLAAVEADKSDLPLASKITKNRPADVHDQCSDGAGTKVLDDLCPEAVVPVYSTARFVAGDRNTADTMRCQLKPLVRGDLGYGVLPFTDEQWATLQAAFPLGVCDYSKPGVDQQPSVPWLDYSSQIGGVPMAEAPVPKSVGAKAAVNSSGADSGMAGGAFSAWWLGFSWLALRRRQASPRRLLASPMA